MSGLGLLDGVGLLVGFGLGSGIGWCIWWIVLCIVRCFVVISGRRISVDINHSPSGSRCMGIVAMLRSCVSVKRISPVP